MILYFLNRKDEMNHFSQKEIIIKTENIGICPVSVEDDWFKIEGDIGHDFTTDYILENYTKKYSFTVENKIYTRYLIRTQGNHLIRGIMWPPGIMIEEGEVLGYYITPKNYCVKFEITFYENSEKEKIELKENYFKYYSNSLLNLNELKADKFGFRENISRRFPFFKFFTYFQVLI
jgi:hypothetical protein